jgi:hypothetical protein
MAAAAIIAFIFHLAGYFRLNGVADYINSLQMKMPFVERNGYLVNEESISEDALSD